MKNWPLTKYPQGDWLNNRKQSFEEQITETEKAIELYQIMIENNHPNTSSLKQELVLRYSRLNALKDVLGNPRLGKLQSDTCRKIIKGLVATRQKGTLWRDPCLSSKQLQSECQKVAHRFPNIQNHIRNVIRLWEYNWG